MGAPYKLKIQFSTCKPKNVPMRGNVWKSTPMFYHKQSTQLLYLKAGKQTKSYNTFCE